MATDLSDFLDEFDEVSSQATRARHQDFPMLLRRWFETMAEAGPGISDRVAWLVSLFSYDRVEAEVLKPQSGMGPGRLDWPEGRELRLSAQLNLFRAMADERFQAWNFAHDYFSTGSRNINDILHEMTDQLFDVHVTELRRYLIRNFEKPASESGLVPASDRFVPINHNQPAYGALVSAIETLSDEVAASNSVATEYKEVIRAELSASLEVLRAPTARETFVRAVVLGPLFWMSVQFAEAAFAPSVQAALALVKFLFPSVPF